MKNNTITIKNEVPELLEAVCEHPKCPQWLKNDIWDAFSNHNAIVSYKAPHWREVLDYDEGDLSDERPFGTCRMPSCDNPSGGFPNCLECSERIIERRKTEGGETVLQGGVQ